MPVDVVDIETILLLSPMIVFINIKNGSINLSAFKIETVSYNRFKKFAQLLKDPLFRD